MGHIVLLICSYTLGDRMLKMKEGIYMKYKYSRLCLKQRWGLFSVCVILALFFAYIAYYAGNTSMTLWKVICGGVLSIICVGLSIFLFCLNSRRKRIEHEFLYEMDKEVRSRERMCPKCGAKIGESNACPKCGFKGH